MSERSVVISVSPHPDDELLGAPATLMELRDEGWRVVNLACSLGRPADEARRRAELTEASERAGFELVLADPLARIGAGDDLDRAQAELSEAIAEQLDRHGARVVTGPSPHDGHHGHEVTGRAICQAIEARGQACAVMFWGLWGELPITNVLTGFGPDRLAEIQRALAAHAGELERNRFDRLLAGRAQANAILGPERVFGYGSPGGRHEYAELLMHVGWSRGRGWRLAAPREFDPAAADDPPSDGPDVGWWLHAPSVAATLRRS